MSMTAAAEMPYNPLRQPGKLGEQMQKAFFSLNETWTPNVNLYETANDYIVCVDLAGVDKEKIEVEVIGQVLKLRGTRAVPAHEEAAGDHPGEAGAPAQRRVRIHLMEIDHGGFCREVELPEDVDKDRIAANHRNGLLWIELPKTAVREAAEAQTEM